MLDYVSESTVLKLRKNPCSWNFSWNIQAFYTFFRYFTNICYRKPTARFDTNNRYNFKVQAKTMLKRMKKNNETCVPIISSNDTCSSNSSSKTCPNKPIKRKQTFLHNCSKRNNATNTTRFSSESPEEPNLYVYKILRFWSKIHHRFILYLYNGTEEVTDDESSIFPSLNNSSISSSILINDTSKLKNNQVLSLARDLRLVSRKMKLLKKITHILR